MDKKLYQMARYPLYMAIFSAFIMLIILLIEVKWIFITGLVVSCFLSISSIAYGIINLRYIYQNENKYRGENMSWISISIGIIVLLSTLPFVLAWIISF
jgi:hypothetical protein